MCLSFILIFSGIFQLFSGGSPGCAFVFWDLWLYVSSCMCCFMYFKCFWRFCSALFSNRCMNNGVCGLFDWVSRSVFLCISGLGCYILLCVLILFFFLWSLLVLLYFVCFCHLQSLILYGPFGFCWFLLTLLVLVTWCMSVTHNRFILIWPYGYNIMIQFLSIGPVIELLSSVFIGASDCRVSLCMSQEVSKARCFVQRRMGRFLWLLSSMGCHRAFPLLDVFFALRVCDQMIKEHVGLPSSQSVFLMIHLSLGCWIIRCSLRRRVFLVTSWYCCVHLSSRHLFHLLCFVILGACSHTSCLSTTNVIRRLGHARSADNSLWIGG